VNLGSRSREEPEINLTSLIDVVLLLLVFFMISTSFVRESRIGVRLPEASAPAPAVAEEQPLIIAVTAQGTYLVNGRTLLDNRPETLRAALQKTRGDRELSRITITADADASHQSVVTAMDAAGQLGFVEINIATILPEQEVR